MGRSPRLVAVISFCRKPSFKVMLWFLTMISPGIMVFSFVCAAKSKNLLFAGLIRQKGQAKLALFG
jgi:hypothetical protein